MRVATNGNFGPVRIPPIPSCLPGPLRLQLRTIRDEVPPMSDTAFRQLVDLLTEQHNETLKKVNTLELSVSTINGQIEVLMGAHNKRVDTQEKDVRKVRDVVLQIAVVLLLTGVLTLGVQYFKGTPPPPAVQSGISKQELKEILEEMRGDRESQSEEVKQTNKPKPRKPPEPQRLNRLKEGDLIATPTIPVPLLANNRIDLPDFKEPK